MSNRDYGNKWFAPSDLPNIKDTTGNSRLSGFIEKNHSLNTFYLIAGICQVFLGLSVITVSILGLIQPLLISILLTMVASVSTMIGFYLMYITVSKWHDSKSLLRSALKRVMKSKN